MCRNLDMQQRMIEFVAKVPLSKVLLAGLTHFVDERQWSWTAERIFRWNDPRFICMGRWKREQQHKHTDVPVSNRCAPFQQKGCFIGSKATEHLLISLHCPASCPPRGEFAVRYNHFCLNNKPNEETMFSTFSQVRCAEWSSTASYVI